MLRIIEKTKIWFSLSLIVILVGFGFIAFRGLNFGIDFKGGTRLVIEMEKGFDKPVADEIVKKYAPDAITKTVEQTQYEIKAKELDESKTSELFNALKEKYKLEDKDLIEQKQISASVGKDLTKKAFSALAVACVAILIYIGIRFEFDFGMAAVIALLHDVLITITVYAVFNVPINSPFIAAILTIAGYSITDTIVIFDRIRENTKAMRRLTPTEIANKSINQTVVRSIYTSLATLVTITCVNILVPTVREFSFPLMLGIACGTFSSIFIASPIWVIFKNRKAAKKQTKIA